MNSFKINVLGITICKVIYENNDTVVILLGIPIFSKKCFNKTMKISLFGIPLIKFIYEYRFDYFLNNKIQKPINFDINFLLKRIKEELLTNISDLKAINKQQIKFDRNNSKDLNCVKQSIDINKNIFMGGGYFDFWSFTTGGYRYSHC
ncbi:MULTISPECIES: hypothetical protein [unclassified Campylobacter]|uniref:hypothetical protein n=1 Tax=unclassified Campylobacter TaxID=2593542 RepID=UPI001DCC6823|nr:hypothetical protein [Campylobacter sp. RM9331]MBZ8005873.1 hypothetical protein [Campylobacter sp. RM9332]